MATGAELTQVQNTVTGRLPPAHVRQSREVPLIPVLDQAPTQWTEEDTGAVTLAMTFG